MLPFGPFELIIILVILAIFFGAGKLGDLGGALRRSITLFKQNAGIGEGEKKDQNKPLKG
jgi:TatA/E family protein of Tat protein translocase